MKSSNDVMRQALRLTRSGDLRAATRTIQDALASGARADSGLEPWLEPGVIAGQTPWIKGEFSVVDGSDPSPAKASALAGAARSLAPTGWRAWPRAAANSVGGLSGVVPVMRSADDGGTGQGDFPTHRVSFDAGDLQYKLYVPPGLDTAGAPLLLMLHGCTQDPEDFARGTRMNPLALAHGYVVAWPAQSADRNPNRCWNWFRGSDQQRGHGEPAMLAALARQLVDTHRLDARRVYVAGLSAGGAMAAVLADTHPDVFAAIGVHSGLPVGLARDMPSAFAAMRKGAARRRVPAGSGTSAVPAIVFHGDGDTTVHPSNGQGVIEQSLGARERDGFAPTQDAAESGTAAGGRSYTRTVHRAADGGVVAEHWAVHGSPHAWSGGDSAGSYTDPSGPDASLEMLRFFGGCRRRE